MGAEGAEAGFVFNERLTTEHQEAAMVRVNHVSYHR